MVFFLPSGPRNEDGDLPNTAASDLALVLAYAVALKIDNMEKVSGTITVGIVISHNQTLWYLQENIKAIRNKIKKQNIRDLGVALTGKEPTDDTLQVVLQWGGYRIRLVPGQSAISTDFDVSIVLNCFDNFFVRTAFRHNVWNSRCKLFNIILCPEPTNTEQEKVGNWDT